MKRSEILNKIIYYRNKNYISCYLINNNDHVIIVLPVVCMDVSRKPAIGSEKLSLDEILAKLKFKKIEIESKNIMCDLS